MNPSSGGRYALAAIVASALFWTKRRHLDPVVYRAYCFHGATVEAIFFAYQRIKLNFWTGAWSEVEEACFFAIDKDDLK
jgi:hypothetical protein